MEDSEPRNTQQDEAAHREREWQQVIQQHLGLVENPVYQAAAKRQNATIYQKNAPIRKRIFREIPV